VLGDRLLPRTGLRLRDVDGAALMVYVFPADQEDLALANGRFHPVDDERVPRTAFQATKSGDWQVASVQAPSTGGTSFMDLAHNTATLDSYGLATKVMRSRRAGTGQLTRYGYGPTASVRSG
jgi:hypothetical protein